MSGGAFEYKQHCIREIHESIQSELDLMGKEKPKEELRYFDKDYLDKYPEEKTYPIESNEVIEIYQTAIVYLKMAEVFAQRIDWYMSGDDGEESLISRLRDDLKQLQPTKKQ